MFNALKKLFLGESNKDENKSDLNDLPLDNKKIELATCAIFLEIANSDDEFSGVERATIIEIMKNLFNIAEDYVEELIQHSEKLIKKSVSLYEFTEIIEKNFSYQDKYKIIENLWRIILADNVINAYEEYFIRKISGNLNIEHKDLIAAKMSVKKELKNTNS